MRSYSKGYMGMSKGRPPPPPPPLHLEQQNFFLQFLLITIWATSVIIASMYPWPLLLFVKTPQPTPNRLLKDEKMLFSSYTSNIIWWPFQFVIFNQWTVRWNWKAFSQNSFVISSGCYITWLDKTLDDLQTRLLSQILLFLQNNSLPV